MSMITWPETVGKIEDGISTFSANSLNPIIDALTVRTSFLKNSLDYLNGSRGLIYTDTGFSPEVSVGTILAWDSASKLYIPARPAFSNVVRADGSVAPAESSYVVGVLISEISSDGFGNILANGWIDGNNALISSILGDVDAPKGAYYLDADNPGRVCLAGDRNVNIPIYCLSYTGDSGTLVFNPRSPEYTGHSHGSAQLPAEGWVSVDKLEVPEHLQVSGTAFSRFDIDPTSAAGSIVSSGMSNSVLVKNGVMVSTEDWCLSEDNLRIYTAFAVLPSDDIKLFMISPLHGIDPVVHSVTVARNENILSIDNVNGNIVLKTNFNTEGVANEELSGTAVVGINSASGVATGPVVHKLSAGVGIDLSLAEDINGNKVPGCYVVSSANACAEHRDMQVLNLDGVLFGTDTDGVSFKFPEAIRSSLFGYFRLPHFEAGKFSAKLNIVLRGTGNSIPSGECDITLVEMPAEGYPTPRHTAIAHSVPGVNDSLLSHNYCVTVDLVDDLVKSDAMLNCRLTYDNPENAVTVLSASINFQSR